MRSLPDYACHASLLDDVPLFFFLPPPDFLPFFWVCRVRLFAPSDVANMVSFFRGGLSPPPPVRLRRRVFLPPLWDKAFLMKEIPPSPLFFVSLPFSRIMLSSARFSLFLRERAVAPMTGPAKESGLPTPKVFWPYKPVRFFFSRLVLCSLPYHALPNPQEWLDCVLSPPSEWGRPPRFSLMRGHVTGTLPSGGFLGIFFFSHEVRYSFVIAKKRLWG